MTTKLIHRPARTTVPFAPDDTVEIEAPPTLPGGKASGGGAMRLLPALGMGGSVLMMTLRGGNGAFALVGGLMLVTTVVGSVVAFVSPRGQASRQRRQQRERYLEYLEELRQRLSSTERELRRRAHVVNPDPLALYDVIRDTARLWERRRADPDFLRVRVGVGEVATRTTNVAEQGNALTPTDAFMMAEARAVRQRYSTTAGMPLLMPLDRVGNVSIIGDRSAVLRAVRALLVQAAALHAPDDLAVAIAAESTSDWAWLKWFPHVLDPYQHDGPVPVRRIAKDPGKLAALLSNDLHQRTGNVGEVRRRGNAGGDALALGPRLLIVHDTHGATAQELTGADETVSLEDQGITVLHLVSERICEPENVSIRLTVNGDELTMEDLRGAAPVTVQGRVDDVGPAAAEGLARLIAPLRLSAESLETSAQAGEIDFNAMLRLDDPAHLDLSKLWAPRKGRAFLRVPIGVDDLGQPVLLDLKESAQLGMGPHGLCVGATGSGKSELLRTLVLGLLLTHPPGDLALMLVDYKGGATFAPFDGLPHLSGSITNLEDDSGLVQRAYDSLSGEVQRRQHMLREAGSVANITDYRLLRKERPDLAPLPHLMVFMDEFGELLTAKPDFIDLFLSIGRIGRSIGVHLLLSSQRLEGGALRGLDTYLSYRLGLRTFSEGESRDVLGTRDAFHLPPLPGFGYLKVDTSVYSQFKGSFVSGPWRGEEAVDEPAKADQSGHVWAYPEFNTLAAAEQAAAASRDEEAQILPERTVGPTTLDVLIRQMVGKGEQVRQIWLPPLPTAVPLDEVVGSIERTDQGLRAVEWDEGPMRVPLGILDDPSRQWQGMWTLDLTKAGGHVTVIGGPQSGKTNLLRAIVAGLGVTHSPGQVAVYAVDLTGGGLAPLDAFPHVGAAAARGEQNRVRRTVEEVHGMLAHREEVFHQRRIDSVDRLRQMHAAGEVPELDTADVVLLIDGFGELREDEYDALNDAVTDLLQRGGSFGIHVVAAMLRSNDMRSQVQTTIGTQIELRLNDPIDSIHDRKLAQTLRADQPGRAITDMKLFGQVALAAIGGVPPTAQLGEATEQLGKAVAEAWPGDPVAQVRLLPDWLDPSLLPQPGQETEAGIPIGIDEEALRPVYLRTADEPHLVIFGLNECGKSNLLTAIVNGIKERFTPKQAKMLIVDYRRSLLDVASGDHVVGYAASAEAATDLLTNTAAALRLRQPGQDVTPKQLRDRNWWTGSDLFLIVDDYELVATQSGNPVAPFQDLVSQAQDVGLHIIIARSFGGAGRAMYDPIIQRMKDGGNPALIMSGDRDEGRLWAGYQAKPLPPGRAMMFSRRFGQRLIQTVWASPHNPDHEVEQEKSL